MKVDVLRWSRTAAALATVALFASACGSDNQDDGSEAPLVGQTILVEPDSEEDTTGGVVVQDAQASAADYTPITVQFDPANPPSDDEVRDLLFAAVQADHANGLWCWANTAACVVDRHLGPAVAGDRYVELSNSLQSYKGENGMYQAGDLDGIFPVSIEANLGNEYGADGFRVVGQVVACEAFNGVYFQPDASGGIGEVLNDTPAGYLREFSVWQGEDGGLRTGRRALTQEGGLELCDEYRS